MHKQVWLPHIEDTKSKPSNQTLNEYIVQRIHSRFFQNTVKANKLIRINQTSNNNHSSKKKKQKTSYITKVRGFSVYL